MSTQKLAALFTIPKNWKQLKCPLKGKLIQKLWHIHTMECYSLTKRNELSNHE